MFSGATADLPFSNGYNRWTSNSDDAELADVMEIDGSLMEGVIVLHQWSNVATIGLNSLPICN